MKLAAALIATSAEAVFGRDWYELTSWELDEAGACTDCGTVCPGVFEALPGTWGAKRAPLRIAS